MHRLFLDLFDRGYQSVILTGSDIPGITIAAVDRAFRLLATRKCDVVIGPAQDGGYYLIGLQKPVVTLFQDIAWSSPNVLEQTLARATVSGLRVSTVKSTYDVDVAADLERLCIDVERSDTLRQSLPKTYRWLQSYHMV